MRFTVPAQPNTAILVADTGRLTCDSMFVGTSDAGIGAD
jgi:hypothetical protein